MENIKFKVGDKVKRINDSTNTLGVGKTGTISEVKINWCGDQEIKLKEYDTCYLFSKNFEKVLEVTTIDDIKFADVITLRNGERYVYADEYLYGESTDQEFDCEKITNQYEPDLINNYRDLKEYDIVKIERAGKVVYERKGQPVKEMTLEQVCKKLGYEVKIVKEGNNE